MTEPKHTPITEADIEDAHDALADFCQAVWNGRRGAGSIPHIFTIPVDRERDADMRIAKVLDGARGLLSENAELRAVVAKAKGEEA